MLLQRAYTHRFGARKPPSKQAIFNLFLAVRKTGDCDFGVVQMWKEFLVLTLKMGMKTLTITGERYRDMLKNLIRPIVKDIPEEWWQQDGATSHSARLTMEHLRQIFGRRII